MSESVANSALSLTDLKNVMQKAGHKNNSAEAAKIFDNFTNDIEADSTLNKQDIDAINEIATNGTNNEDAVQNATKGTENLKANATWSGYTIVEDAIVSGNEGNFKIKDGNGNVGTATITYGSDGSKIAKITIAGTEITKKYDSNGKIREKTTSEKDTIITREYDSSGKVNIQTTTDKDGKMLRINYYDDNGQIARSTKYNQDGQIECVSDYEFDAEGNKIGEYRTIKEGSPDYGKVESYVIVYDKNDDKKRTRTVNYKDGTQEDRSQTKNLNGDWVTTSGIKYNSAGKVEYTNEYTYDENGVRTGKTSTPGEGCPDKDTVKNIQYAYDKEGKKTSKTVNNKDKSKVVTDYNANGEPTNKTKTDKNGNTVATTTYKDGKKLERTETKEDGTKVVTTYDSKTGNPKTKTETKADGTKVVKEYDTKTGKATKKTEKDKNGKTVSTSTYKYEYDKSGNVTKRTETKSDKTVVVTEYDTKTGNPKTKTETNKNGKVVSTSTCDSDGKVIKKVPGPGSTDYKKVNSYTYEYNSDGSRTRKTNYKDKKYSKEAVQKQGADGKWVNIETITYKNDKKIKSKEYTATKGTVRYMKETKNGKTVYYKETLDKDGKVASRKQVDKCDVKEPFGQKADI